MSPNDPFRPLRDWRFTLFRGEPSAISQFLRQLDAGLPDEWTRDAGYERERPRPDRVRCYLFDRPDDVSVRVWLQIVTPTRVRSGAVQLLRHSFEAASARVVELVSSFTSGSVLPAAASAGVRHSQPMFGPRSAVPFLVDQLFTRLADTADGEWPLREEAQVVWDELVSTCLSGQAAIDRTELMTWLADSGWSPADVDAITRRFFADAEWLSKRLAVAAS